MREGHVQSFCIDSVRHLCYHGARGFTKRRNEWIVMTEIDQTLQNSSAI